MHGEITVDEKNLIAVKEAAQAVGYSRDYITRLAREQKIIAAQISRQWFVNLGSLQSFVEVVEIEKKARKNQLRAERQIERSLYEEQQKFLSDVQSQVVRFSPRSYIQSWSIIIAGLFLGVIINSVQFSYFSDGADQVAQLPTVNISDTTVIVEEISSLDSVDFSNEESLDREIVVVSKASKEIQEIPRGHGVLLIPELATAENSDNPTVNELFSDEIKVKEGRDKSGYVVPVYDNGQEGVVVPYVMIPIDTYSESINETLGKKHYE